MLFAVGYSFVAEIASARDRLVTGRSNLPSNVVDFLITMEPDDESTIIQNEPICILYLVDLLLEDPTLRLTSVQKKRYNSNILLSLREGTRQTSSLCSVSLLRPKLNSSGFWMLCVCTRLDKVDVVSKLLVFMSVVSF